MSGEDYGYRIIKKVRRLSKGELAWSDGMLYPVLQRLERDGLISSRWEMSAAGRHRKYFRITEAGREALVNEKRQWLAVDAALKKLWEPLASA
jgi:DNA-binding PadR family transcriptional regulator